MFPHLRYTREEIGDYFLSVTEEAISASLRKSRPGWFDLLNLISPTASAFIEPMREQARRARLRHYGRTVSVYAPLYIGNTCVNSCLYCDFSQRRKGLARRNLTLTEIDREADALKRSNLDTVLVVAGEDPLVNTVEHLVDVGRLLSSRFSNLLLEVAPQSENAYRQLFAAGYEGLVCFQETYDPACYRMMHPSGPKSDYTWRLETQLRAGRAGFRTLGCAFLLGLAPWREEAASLAAHALYLMRECPHSKIQFAFPRLCRVEGGFLPPCEVGEHELEQLMLAFRIAFPQCAITVSTRESPEFRDQIVLNAADNMSAGSRTTPGGYAAPSGDIAQFQLNDSRPPNEVYAAIRSHGQEVVFKTWDGRIRDQEKGIDNGV
ncbi:MAG: 2-iminoacetate synthase ThiH [Kiritimatiellia bacterium]|nr:2-iminoacetate synthase ThiH [Kiritimatiellia bacterium]